MFTADLILAKIASEVPCSPSRNALVNPEKNTSGASLPDMFSIPILSVHFASRSKYSDHTCISEAAATRCLALSRGLDVSDVCGAEA